MRSSASASGLLLVTSTDCVPLARSTQLGFINGVKFVTASTAAVLSTTEIPCSSLLGIFFLGQPTNPLAVLGNVVALGGCALVARGAGSREAKPASEPREQPAAGVAANEEGGDMEAADAVPVTPDVCHVMGMGEVVAQDRHVKGHAARSARAAGKYGALA